MPNIIVREYNPESGILLGNITTLKFGKVISGSHSRVKVIDIAFEGVRSVSNIRLGIISNSGIAVNTDPQNLLPDGTASNGNFGIEHSGAFEQNKTKNPLSRHFAGLNGTASSSDRNNVLVGQRNDNISNYIYLDVRISAGSIGKSNGAYKIFFDYS